MAAEKRGIKGYTGAIRADVCEYEARARDVLGSAYEQALDAGTDWAAGLIDDGTYIARLGDVYDKREHARDLREFAETLRNWCDELDGGKQ